MKQVARSAVSRGQHFREKRRAASILACKLEDLKSGFSAVTAEKGDGQPLILEDRGGSK